MTIRNVTHARLLSPTLLHGISKNEIRQRNIVVLNTTPLLEFFSPSQKRASSIQYGYRKARVFSRILAQENSKIEKHECSLESLCRKTVRLKKVQEIEKEVKQKRVNMDRSTEVTTKTSPDGYD